MDAMIDPSGILSGFFPDNSMIEVLEPTRAPLSERLRYGTALHAVVLERLKKRSKISRDALSKRHSQWNRSRRRMRMYGDLGEKSLRKDREEDAARYALPFRYAFVLPFSYAQVQALLTQLMSIWGARSPIIQLEGVGPEDVGPAKLMEVLVSYDSQQNILLSKLYSAFYDALVCGIGCTYDHWELEYGFETKYEPIQLPGIPPDLVFAILGKAAFTPVRKRGIKREYQNIARIDPFCMRPDPRIQCMADLQSGEFFGHTFSRHWIDFKEREEPDGPYFNLSALKGVENPRRHAYEDREETPYDEMSRYGQTLGEEGFVSAETMTIRLVPSDWVADGEEPLGPENYPVYYTFTWAKDQVICRADPLPNDHQSFPYSVFETEADFHSLFSPGIVELLGPIQDWVDWIYNSHSQNIVKMLNNQYIYLPGFLDRVDLEYGGPGEHIRATQTAIDQILSGNINSFDQILHQVQVRDVTGPSYMNAIQFLQQAGQMLAGTNNPMTGIELPTARTATEIGTIVSKASDRMTMVAMLMDAIGFKPMVRRWIANRQQFTEEAQYHRIVGDLRHAFDAGSIWISRDNIQGNFDYVPTDGLIPSDPARQSMVWANLMATVGGNPALQQMTPDGRLLNMFELFNEAARRSGVKNIERFYHSPRPTIMPDEEVDQMAASGQLMPYPDPGLLSSQQQGMLPPGGM